ncbi:MAG: GAF domain-containing protein [Thermoflexales bacterium]|nr:GAF domain-containing protein [Thermoflexales bacterium]MDW8351317.1 GAF domain-containing protein [Anaerolineae bacterium]
MSASRQAASRNAAGSVALVRAELQRKKKELAAIREILLSINATSDLRSILNGIAQTTTRVMRVDSTSIYLLDRSSQRLILKATTGLFPQAIDHGYLHMGEGLTGWAAQHRQVVAVRDAQRDPRFHEVPNTRERSFKSLMAVPLISQDRVVGAINVQTHRRHTWKASEIEFVSLIGEVVAGILERAILQEESERKVREMQAVAEVSRAAISPLYLDETLRVVAEMGARAVNARHCSVLLLDETVNAFMPRAIYDRKPNIPPEPPWRLDDLPLLNIERLSEPVLVNETCCELQAAHANWAAQAQLGGLMCVPMQVRDRTIGLLNMWTEGAGEFTEAQVELCTTLANQIALAIENAHLIGNAAIVKEMNHRVKNNLQNVVMLLQMQLHDASDKLTAKEVLHESINRIMSIAAVHDALAQEGFRLVDVKDVITRVVGLTQANMARPDLQLAIHVMGDSLRMSSRAATALALCVNELVQNAMEHAFVGRDKGEITISLIDCGGTLEVEVRDNGLGKAAGGMDAPSLGLNIVNMLVQEDLRGTFTLKRTARGTRAVIKAPFSYTDING